MSWVPGLLGCDSFFKPCAAHAGSVVNIYSLEQCAPLCPLCARGQPAASLLQVRPRRARKPPLGPDTCHCRPVVRHGAARARAARCSAALYG